MAGLYFHIPFCKRICAYCDFFREADLSLMPSAVEAIHSEMEEQHDFLHDGVLRTIYFGGGTPSLLHPREIQSFIDHASELWDCSGVEEITLEANPDDITEQYVEALRSTAVNRVSLGVQSFDDGELRFMNRRHTAAEAEAAVRRLQDAGIENITIDLIFGVDGYGEDVLLKSLERALSLGIQHVSAYHLTIEERTAFWHRLQRGQMRVVDEERSEREYALIHNVLSEAGYEHYEVSNYALSGYRSRHNSSYWQGVEYLGVGVGAHSFNGDVRRWSEQSVAEYVERREYVSERLCERDHYNEYVMTSLRRVEGVSIERVASRFGEARKEAMMQAAKRWILSGDVVENEGQIRIPAHSFLISDAVIESLFEA